MVEFLILNEFFPRSIRFKLNSIGEGIFQTYLFSAPVSDLEVVEPESKKLQLKPKAPKPPPKQSQTQRIPKPAKVS